MLLVPLPYSHVLSLSLLSDGAFVVVMHPQGGVVLLFHLDGTGVVERKILEIRPTSFFLGLLRVHPQYAAIAPSLTLQTRHDSILLTPLIGTKTVGSANDLTASHSLCMPGITVQSTCQVLVLLLLQEIVVVTLLFEESTFNAETEVADAFSHAADCIFVHRNQVCVLSLLVLVCFDKGIFLDDFALEFADACFCLLSAGCGRWVKAGSTVGLNATFSFAFWSQSIDLCAAL